MPSTALAILSSPSQQLDTIASTAVGIYIISGSTTRGYAINRICNDTNSSSTTGSNASTALVISSIPAAQLDVYQRQ
jgi:hypothetical protein